MERGTATRHGRRPGAGGPAALGALLAALLLAAPATGAPFAPRVSLSLRGDLTLAANTIVTCQAAEPGCAATQAGGAGQNNSFVMRRVDVDADPATFDSSTAPLKLPPGASVRFAGLYWGARTDAGAGGGAPDPAAAATVRLTTPAGAAVVSGALTGTGTLSSGAGYQAFADVTALVSSGGAGAYTVADVQAATGRSAWGGWSLVVIYADDAEPARNLTVFDGYQTVTLANPDASVSVSGFRTPAAGPVRARVGVVAYEGDRGFTGDTLRLDGTALGGPLNPVDDFFDSGISILGEQPAGRVPDYANELGLDAALVGADGILPNGATQATAALTAGADEYAVGVVATAIDLYAPDVGLTTTATDLNGGALTPGDELEYRVTATNAGQDDATGLAVTLPAPAGTEPVGAEGPVAVGDGVLAAGQSASVAVRVRVAAGTPVGTLLVTRPRADYAGRTLGTPFTTLGDPVSVLVDGAPAPAPAAIAAPPVARATRPARLVLRVSGPARARGGAVLTYVLGISNRGDLAARGLTVRVLLPARLRLAGPLRGMEIGERSLRMRVARLGPGVTHRIAIRLAADRVASGAQPVTAAVVASNAAGVSRTVRSRITPGGPCPPLAG